HTLATGSAQNMASRAAMLSNSGMSSGDSPRSCRETYRATNTTTSVDNRSALITAARYQDSHRATPGRRGLLGLLPPRRCAGTGGAGDIVDWDWGVIEWRP